MPHHAALGAGAQARLRYVLYQKITSIHNTFNNLLYLFILYVVFLPLWHLSVLSPHPQPHGTHIGSSRKRCPGNKKIQADRADGACHSLLLLLMLPPKVPQGPPRGRPRLTPFVWAQRTLGQDKRLCFSHGITVLNRIVGLYDLLIFGG